MEDLIHECKMLFAGYKAISEPPTPPAGFAIQYLDVADNCMKVKYSTGSILNLCELGGGGFDPFDLTKAHLIEQFLGGFVFQGYSGGSPTSDRLPLFENGWLFHSTDLGTVDGDLESAPDYGNHPGVVYMEAGIIGTGVSDAKLWLRADPASPTVKQFHIGNTPAWRARWGFAAGETGSTKYYFVGLIQGNPESGGSNLLGIIKRFTDTNWHMANGDGTYTDTGVAVNTNWHLAEVYTKTDEVTLGISLDGTEEGEVDMTGNEGMCAPIVSVAIDSTDATAYMYFDRYDLRITGLARYA